MTPESVGIGIGIGTEYVSMECKVDGPAMGDSESPFIEVFFFRTRFGFSSGFRTYPYCPFSPCAGFFWSTI